MASVTTKVKGVAAVKEQVESFSNTKLLIRSMTRKSLYQFIKYFWDTYSQDEFIGNWHIKIICHELERMAARVATGKAKEHDLVVNVPPGSSKTAIVSIFYPIWCWIKWHDLKFITASYAQSLAMESAEYSREVIRSEKFRNIFPELDIKQDKDTKTNFRVVKKTWNKAKNIMKTQIGGNRFSTSVGGSVTGFHGHINIVDDPLDPLGARSEAEVKKANYWMNNVLPFRKANKKTTITIMIMQRLHMDDPTGHWIETRPNKIKLICLPGEIKNYKDQVHPPELIKNYVDGLLDPIRLDWSVLDDYQELGQFTYGSQIGQSPIPLGGGMFKTDHIQVIDAPPHILEIVQVVRYWDKAATVGDGAYTVGAKMCKLKSGIFVILDVKRGQWSSDERERIIKECAVADGTLCKVYVEQEPGSGGKESADNTVKNLAGFSVFKDRPTGDKIHRADPYSVQVNNGNVQVVRAAWNKEYLDELEHFPNSKYKDQTDASSGSFSKLTALRRVQIMNR